MGYWLDTGSPSRNRTPAVSPVPRKRVARRSRVKVLGLRYYKPGLGRWIVRDPIDENGGIGLYGFCRNDGINKQDKDGQTWDDFQKKNRREQIPKAWGVTASALYVAGASDYFRGELSTIFGVGGSVIFFPDTCQLGAFTLTAASVELVEPASRGLPPILATVVLPPTTPRKSVTIGRRPGGGGGFYVGVGYGAEYAVWVGGTRTAETLTADSFSGPFRTVTGAWPTVPVAPSLYWSAEPDTTRGGGHWVGGTVTRGPGIGAAFVDWTYTRVGPVVDLDSPAGVIGLAGKCLCHAIILANPL